jgi:hypothetical protein
MTPNHGDIPGFLVRYYENFTRESLARLIVSRLPGAGGERPKALDLLEPLLTEAPRQKLIEWLVNELLQRMFLRDEWNAYVAAKTEDLQVLWGMDAARAATGAVRQAVGLGLRPAPQSVAALR